MKKLLIPIIVFGVGFAAYAFATSSGPLSVSPSSAVTGSEASLLVTYDATGNPQGTNTYFLVYDHTGALTTHSPSAGLPKQATSSVWTTGMSLASGLTPDTYLLYMVAGANNDQDGRIAACNTQALCDVFTALFKSTTTVTITSAVASNPPKMSFNWINDSD